jgi:hypothetical protein
MNSTHLNWLVTNAKKNENIFSNLHSFLIYDVELFTKKNNLLKLISIAPKLKLLRVAVFHDLANEMNDILSKIGITGLTCASW